MDKKTLKKCKNAQEEAYRYLDNAEKILLKGGRVKNKKYADSKYAKAGGEIAWKGILMALDPMHAPMKYIDKKNRFARKSVQSYRDILDSDKDILTDYNNAYSSLHIAMGYDGNTKVSVKQSGWEDALKIIQWAKANYHRIRTCRTCKKTFVPERKNIVNCPLCR